ncbi:MAG TPA: hypothetical protein VFD58_07005 [Blastocatellia bacterium]|nr:hypothetical protein [Blastocatellia bacterium]
MAGIIPESVFFLLEQDRINSLGFETCFFPDIASLPRMQTFAFTINTPRCYDRVVMVANLKPKITALEALAAANLFLSDHLPDRYCADDPKFDRTAGLWRVPVVMAYPFIGPIGRVGEITVSAFSEEVSSHTPFEEMRSRGRELYKQHREAIEAAFLQAGNS